MSQSTSFSDRTQQSRHFRSVSFSRGFSFNEGMASQGSVYLVQSGLCTTLVTLRDASTIGTGLSSAGDLIRPELSGGSQHLRSTTEAITQGSVLRIPMAHFQSVMDTNLAFRNCLFAEISRRVCELEAAVACTRFHTLQQRLAGLLLAIQAKTGSSTLLLTQAILARQLGSLRTSVVAVMAALRSEGLLSLSRGTIRLENAARLKAIACACHVEAQQDEAERLRARFMLQQHLLSARHTAS